MASVLTSLAVVAVCGLLLWIAYRMEPHWVSKDGERLVCYGQGLSRNGQTDTRWREVRVFKLDDDTLEVRPRRGGFSTATRSGATATTKSLVQKRLPKASQWKVIGRSETPPRRRVVFLLDSTGGPDLPDMLALRLPLHSRALPMLDALAARRYLPTPSTPNPETPRSEGPPDPD